MLKNNYKLMALLEILSKGMERRADRMGMGNSGRRKN